MPLTARKPSQSLVNLVGALGGSWHGYVGMCRCPAHTDSKPSLSLRQGDHDILVTCFAGCAREDVLRELRLVRPDRVYAAPNRAAAPGTANIERLWERASPVAGSLAERYLRSRRLEPTPGDVRFLDRCPYGPRPTTVFEPALLVAVREGPRLVALQRIFLDRATGRYTRKVMLGLPAGGAWRGPPATHLLAVAEGFETAAAFTRLHGIPCWASLGARRLDLLRLPENVTELVLAHDRDAAGARAADKAQARYARPNLSIRRAPPPPPFNDWSQVLEARP